MEYNVYDFKTNLSKIVDMILKDKTDEPIYLCKYGKPIAQLVPFLSKKSKRIGIAKNKIPPIDFDEFESIDVKSLFNFE